MAKRPVTKMTQQEIKDWKELCDYVKGKILGYDENQKFPKVLAIRLKGLAEGNFMANRNTPKAANYSFRTILNTFKVCRIAIQTGFSKNKFSDEQHRINYMMVIVESKIDDVYMREKKLKQTKEKMNNLDSNNITEDIKIESNYKRKTKLKKSIDELL